VLFGGFDQLQQRLSHVHAVSKFAGSVKPTTATQGSQCQT
jgi:hypothetical protein